MAVNHPLFRVLVALSFSLSVFATNGSVPFANFVNKPGNANNLTIAVNVPKTSTTDELFVHFTAPAQYQWAGFGFGQQMSGSLMFMMYPAADGHNITLSPRIASGESQPTLTSNVKITTLAGSGIQAAAGRYILNFHCTGCRKWLSSQINLNSDGQGLIWATGPQQPNLQKDMLKSDSLSQNLMQHSDYGSGQKIVLSQAVGDGGVPVPANNTQPITTSATDDAEIHEFPILIHALLLIAVFVFVFPSGYLFLRIFNRVWLHAGIQTLGFIGVLAGVAAGVVYNVQTKRSLSYHQILGAITTILILTAFTLGLISHAYFKKHQTSSPLLKIHRIVGPTSIILGWTTSISGFVFAGEPRRTIPLALAMAGVIAFVGSITFMLHKRRMRKGTMQTPAAQNFYTGYAAEQQAASFHGPGEAVPMNTFGGVGAGAAHAYAQKQPAFGVQPVGYR